MDSIESELLSKLVNVFGFNFKKNYQELTKPELFDVYKLLLKCYDESWVLSADQPDQKNLKKIQGYLKIIELGHLIGRDTKFDELVDPKRNARLLGGLIAKLESRHTTAKLQGIIRKIKLAKVKLQTGKRSQLQKNYSSESSAGEEEPKKEVQVEELVVPVKGKEIPRTPPVSGKTDLKSEEFLKPAPAVSSRSQAQKTAANKKNFEPILPTKEIPRTPLKGAQSQPSADISLYGRNPDLTVDFSVSRLTSSNTSTPYEERSSSKSTETGDATFVVPPKLSESLETPSEELASPPLPDIKNIRRGTFVLTQPKVPQQDSNKMSEENMRIDAEVADEAEQQQDEVKASPEAPESKRKGGRQQKNKNAKNVVEQEKQVEAESKTESSDVSSSTVKGKKGRGKKAAAADLSAEPEALATERSVPEIKEKRGRWKAAAKAPAKESAPESEEHLGEAKSTEEVKPIEEVKPAEVDKSIEEPKPAEGENFAEEVKSNDEMKPAEEVKSAPMKQGRARKGKQQEPEAKDQTEAKENDKTAEPIAEPSPKPQTKKGRGKQAKEPEKTEEISAEPKVEPSPKTETRKGRGRQAKEPEKTEEAPAEAVVEASPKVEAKKGRGKQNKEPVTEKNEEASAESAMEPQAPEVKKGRGKLAKEPAVEDVVNESTETNEGAMPEVPDTKAKKARGKKTKIDETPAEKTDDKKAATPEVKEAAKGGRKAASKPETEPTRKSARNKPETAKSYEELDSNLEEAKEPAAQKKARAKRGKAAAKAEEPSENIEEPSDEDAKKEVENQAPKTEAPKGKRNNKRNGTKAAQGTVEEKDIAVKSPERPLKPVNETEDETSSPSKRRNDDDDADDAPPEKKKRGRAAKKDTAQSAQVENQPPAEKAPVKRGAKNVKEAPSEAEKKKPAAKKKMADTKDDETDETISPSKPKRAARSTPQVNKIAKETEPQFVTHVADPSPAARAPAKGRRLKLVEEPAATETVEKEAKEEAVAAPAKRGGRARKAK